MARYDGDQFAYVACVDDVKSVYAKMEGIREQIQSMTFGDAKVTISGGFACCGVRTFMDYKHILSCCDELLSKAKARGKNQICF